MVAKFLDLNNLSWQRRSFMQNFLLFQQIGTATGHVSENALCKASP